MRSAPKERGQGRVHGEWHGAELAEWQRQVRTSNCHFNSQFNN